MVNRQVLGFILLSGIICFASSCKLGCTDKNAFNYSHSAKENDGSCLYCDSTAIDNGSQSISIEDVNSQSQYYFQYVLRALVTSQELQLNGNGCGVIGYGNGSSSCNRYSNTLQLLNLTSHKITFTGTLFVNYNSQDGIQQTLTYNFNSAQVGPFDTLNVGGIGSVCVPGNFVFFELEMNTNNNTISYN